MKAQNFKLGEKVFFRNGSYESTGEILKIKENTLIIGLDDQLDLYKSGYAVGDEICFSQVIY